MTGFFPVEVSCPAYVHDEYIKITATQFYYNECGKRSKDNDNVHHYTQTLKISLRFFN